ncbi:hypothetical protein Csa_008328 [Cucumis sativus]|nr:hypothetical protein Csa_008328 [Cucumis sativus]
MAFLFLILRHCSINNLLEEFEYDSTHPINLGIGFKEDEIPNFIGSFYSKTKAMNEIRGSNSGETFAQKLIKRLAKRRGMVMMLEFDPIGPLGN